MQSECQRDKNNVENSDIHRVLGHFYVGKAYPLKIVQLLLLKYSGIRWGRLSY